MMEEVAKKSKSKFLVSDSFSHKNNHKHEHGHVDSVDFPDNLVFDDNNFVYVIFYRLLVILHVFSAIFYGILSSSRFTHDESYYSEYMKITSVLEVFFFIDMILNFFKHTENHNLHIHQKEKSFRETSTQYYEERFWWDFIALIPFQYLQLKKNR